MGKGGGGEVMVMMVKCIHAVPIHSSPRCTTTTSTIYCTKVHFANKNILCSIFHEIANNNGRTWLSGTTSRWQRKCHAARNISKWRHGFRLRCGRLVHVYVGHALICLFRLPTIRVGLISISIPISLSLSLSLSQPPSYCRQSNYEAPPHTYTDTNALPHSLTHSLTCRDTV